MRNPVTNLAARRAGKAHDRIPELRDWGIQGIPPFRRILTATPGHPLELGQDMQSRMALLEIELNHVIAVVDEEGLDHPEFDNLLARARGFGLSLQDTIELPYSRVQQLAQCELAAAEEGRSAKSSLPLVDNHADKMLKELLEYAVKERATDVHIKILDDNQEHPSVKVQLRIDGRLRPHPYLSNAGSAAPLRKMIQVVYGARIDAGSNSESGHSDAINQYATITLVLGGKTRTLRYQSFKIQHGNRYVIRIPDERESESTDLASLHYMPTQLGLLRKVARQKYGAVLFCGTVNTGKTTSMQRMVLNTPHAEELHIASLEDPIEGHIMGHKVSRIAIQRGAEGKGGKDGNNPFARTVRDLLRGDIDVFYMGEIRDRETASAFEAAIQTGHKGYATLHLGSAFSAIPRLSGREIGISRESVATEDFLAAIISQRLMPRLCSKCSISPLEATNFGISFDQEQKEALAALQQKFKIKLGTVRIRRTGVDCQYCKGTGTVDRILIAEVVVPDAHMFKLWREGRDADAKEYWRKTRKAPFDDPDCSGKTAYEHGIYRVSVGEIDPFDLDAVIPLSFYDVVPVGDL